jgi:hypothetical protein
MNYFILTYAVYLVASIALTVWVAKVLFKNGRIFLVDIFHGNAELADSVNKLLVVGFYLINIGYMSMELKEEGLIVNTQSGRGAEPQTGLHYINPGRYALFKPGSIF